MCSKRARYRSDSSARTRNAYAVISPRVDCEFESSSPPFDVGSPSPPSPPDAPCYYRFCWRFDHRPASVKSSFSSSSFFARWLTIEPRCSHASWHDTASNMLVDSIRKQTRTSPVGRKRVGSVYIRNGRILFWFSTGLTKDRRFALCAIFIFPRTYSTTNSFD